MQIIVRGGAFDAERDIEPNGPVLWSGGDDELPAAVLAAMTTHFQPGTWYEIEEFEKVVGGMALIEGELEVTGAVTAEQLGVTNRWTAAIEVGQSKAALMICRSVLNHAKRLQPDRSNWIRVD